MADASPADELRVFRSRLVEQRRALVRKAVSSRTKILTLANELTEIQDAIEALDQAAMDEAKNYYFDSGLEGHD